MLECYFWKRRTKIILKNQQNNITYNSNNKEYEIEL